MPALRDVYRAAGREVASTGAGVGGAIATLRFNTVANRRQHFQSWFVQEGMQEMAVMAGVNKVHLWRADNSASAIETVESSKRGGNSEVRDWAVAIEGCDVSFVLAACDCLQRRQAFTETLENSALVGIHRLMFRLDA